MRRERNPPRFFLPFASALATIFGTLVVAAGCSGAELDGAREASTEEDAGVQSDAARESDADADATTDGDAPDAAPLPDLGPGGDFKGHAHEVAAALHAMYDPSSGVYAGVGWWNSANAITSVIDHGMATGSTAYLADVETTFTLNSGGFLTHNDYYDDEGWWALAWVRAYDWTHSKPYLDEAKAIFADMKKAWDTTCKGGVWQTRAKKYKNAITNELFLALAAALHARTPGDGGPGSYLAWATRTWSWFDASTMIAANKHGLVVDGLAADCSTTGHTNTFTYNQGVIVGGLVELGEATSDPSLLVRATAIASATMTHLVDSRGVLHEPAGATPDTVSTRQRSAGCAAPRRANSAVCSARSSQITT